MAQPRRRSSPRLTRDALRLVTLAQALNLSGSRLEDLFWETQLGEVITKLLKAGQDATLEAALEHLSQHNIGGYEILVEQAETLSESMKIEKDSQRYDILLIVAPIVAWTRYTIPSGPISIDLQKILLTHLHAHILSSQAQSALLPWLVSVDQMPHNFSETWQWLQRLGAQALGAEVTKLTLHGEPEAVNMLADTRYIVTAVAVPEYAPIFRWQESSDPTENGRAASLTQWSAQTQATLASLLPGCGIEILLPDAYYMSNREADRRIRPLSLRAAVSWLESAVKLDASQLRAVIAACGDDRADEYRIGFTPRNSNEVYYGCVWPLYSREEEMPGDEGMPDAIDEIAALLKEYGVHDIRRIPGLLTNEYCEDCTAPFFPNPLGELVHAELPEDAEDAPQKFH